MEEVGQKRASDDRVGLSPVCIDCRVGGRRGRDKAHRDEDELSLSILAPVTLKKGKKERK